MLILCFSICSLECLQKYLENTLTAIVTSEKSFPYKSDILLLYTLLVSWLYTPNIYEEFLQPNGPCFGLKNILKETTLHYTIEAYVHNLIENNQHLLIFSFLNHLSKGTNVLCTHL